MDAVAVACELALDAGTPSAEVVLNILRRFPPQQATEPVPTPDGLKLQKKSKADVNRYEAPLSKLPIGMSVSLPLTNQIAHGVAHAAR